MGGRGSSPLHEDMSHYLLAWDVAYTPGDGMTACCSDSSSSPVFMGCSTKSQESRKNLDRTSEQATWDLPRSRSRPIAIS